MQKAILAGLAIGVACSDPRPRSSLLVESSLLNTDRIRRRSGSRQGGGTRPMPERRCEETSEIARVADAGPFHESPYQPADEKGQRHQSYWSPDAECALRQFEHQPMGQIQAIRNSTKPLWQVGLRETDFETPNERSMLRRQKKSEEELRIAYRRRDDENRRKGRSPVSRSRGSEPRVRHELSGGWLNVAYDLAPPTPYFHWFHTLCDFPGAGPRRLAEALASRPRFLVVADPSKRFQCELENMSSARLGKAERRP